MSTMESGCACMTPFLERVLNLEDLLFVYVVYLVIYDSVKVSRDDLLSRVTLSLSSPSIQCEFSVRY